MKVYVTDGETIVLEDDTSYQLVCCDCGLTHELEVRRLSPGHRTLIKIRRISESRIAELEAENKRLKEALENVLLAVDHEDYYNDAVLDVAREAIKED